MAVFSRKPSKLMHLKRSTMEDMDHSITAAQLHRMNEHADVTTLEEEASEEIASAMLIGDCLTKEEGLCEVESASAYGAAVIMPQLARSAGWPIFLTFLTARVWFFLLLNFYFQFNLLYMITREQEVIDAMHGQMFLCNFASGSRGPLGSEVTPSGTYPWKQWALRCFLKDSLKRIFPEQAETIESSVDVGEYALESFAARWVCCYIFVLVTTSELDNIYSLARLLYYVPSKPQPWLDLKSDGDNLLSNSGMSVKLSGTSIASESSRARTQSRKPLAEDELGGRVSIRIAGMPRAWKIVNALFVLVPKMMLWKLCNQIGVDFLMETSGIEDLIVNAVAMSFILNLDEMICTVFMSQPTKEVLGRCEPFVVYDTVSRENLTHQEILRRYGLDQTFQRIPWREWHRLIPWKLLLSFAMLCTFIMDYYHRHCEFDHGQIVSRAMYKPMSENYNFLTMMFPNLADKGAGNEDVQPFWEMPPPFDT